MKAKGGKPYPIPAGASVHKFGGLGYVGFAEEVRAQEEQLGFKFDYIVVCTVTGSTHAGMVVGFAKDGRQRNVIGIDASFTPAQTKAQVLDIAQKTSALIGGKDIVADDIVLNEDYAYPVYGVPSKETIEAIRLSARLEGMMTDPVYEGKSMQGVIDLVKMRAIYWDDSSQGMRFEAKDIPAELAKDAALWREKMVEAAAEANEELMNKYLEEGDLSDTARGASGFGSSGR